MSETLKNTERVEEDNSNSWDAISEVPFAGEHLEKKQVARKEYLDILSEVGADLESANLGENSIEVVIDAAGTDGEKYKDEAGKLQRAANILDAEMMRRKMEKAYYSFALELGKTPEEEAEKREQLTNARNSALEKMQAAHNFAQAELRQAYPELSDREAGKEFFGYESWAIKPSELSTVNGGENDGKTFDAEGVEVSSERNPSNKERFDKINKAIELRSEMHSSSYSDNLPSEIGIFRSGEV
ncbi:hypothetical protein IKF27_00380 [Candidatus Saccharibacteria bacterium]|nr:hypothetical protein [Candidatus Saccharibacteria bacterium]